jgi:hypothetical protein
MNSTLTKVVLLPGHEMVELSTLTFFGTSSTRKVSIHSLTSVLGKRNIPRALTKQEASSAVGMSLATTEVQFLDVNEMLVNAKDEAEAAELMQKPAGLVARSRYILDPDAASTYRHEQFLKFMNAPIPDEKSATPKVFQ